ncbi:hypothetical protein M405DRAFT_825821, partial [Rhizopogon salebrosus TDB-379]
MPVLASSTFLEAQAVISSLPQSQEPTRSSLHPPPLAVYALAQAASMTLHILLLNRNPFLNDHAM